MRLGAAAIYCFGGSREASHGRPGGPYASGVVVVAVFLYPLEPARLAPLLIGADSELGVSLRLRVPAKPL